MPTHDERKESFRAQVAYQPVPTEDPKKLNDSIGADERSCGVRLIHSLWFQNLMGLVIVANSAVLGMETDIHGHGELFDKVETIFLGIFFVEILLKLAVEGCAFCNPRQDEFVWNVFDAGIVGLGLFDLVARYLYKGKGTGGFSTIFRTFRLLRILRIFRLLRFLKRLYLLAMGLIEAAKAIFWVTILMCFVLYVCALVLVKTVGQPHSSDPHFPFLQYHFGSIAESMFTLFVLMSSPNLPIYQEEVGLLESRPLLTIFLIIFVTFGSFGMIAMLTGVINESMFENNELQKEEKRAHHEKMRQTLGERSADLFSSLQANAEGEVDIEQIQHIGPQVIELVEAAGAEVAHGDINNIIRHMDVDRSGSVSMAEFVHAIEKIAEVHSPMAILEVHYNVGKCQRKLESLEERANTTLKRIDEMAKSAKGLDASGFAEFMQNALSHHAQMLSDQITSSESRLHLAVTNQIGDIRMSVQRLFDLTADDGEVRLRHKIEDIRSSVQRLLDGDCGRESSISAAVAVLGTSIQKIQSQLNDSTIRGAGGASESVAVSVERLVESVDRLVEKDNSDGRRMIAVASQMQAIQTSVQKLVGAKEDRDVKHFEELKDVRLSMQRIFDQAQQSSDVRVQQLQCQVNSAHSDLLSGVAELGAVVLSGVGDLLTKRMVSLQADLLSGLQASQELTIQKLCVKSTDAEADAYPPETTSKT